MLYKIRIIEFFDYIPSLQGGGIMGKDSKIFVIKVISTVAVMVFQYVQSTIEKQ